MLFPCFNQKFLTLTKFFQSVSKDLFSLRSFFAMHKLQQTKKYMKKIFMKCILSCLQTF